MESMGINKDFWKNKKVFITGHTGFKGSWLSIWLKQLGASVIGYALPPRTVPNLFDSANVKEDLTSIYGNINDLSLLKQAVEEHQPEIIFHLAAQPLVSYSYKNPLETYMVNVMGTAHLLEAIRSTNSIQSAVMVTSDKCYENKEWVWGYRETDRLGGYDPYSSSKGCAELVISAYQRSFFSEMQNRHIGIASVRAGNVIGGGDWNEGRLIPDLIRSFIKDEAEVIRSPYAYRPWQYILDLLQGYLILAEKLWAQGSAFNDAWNFGPSEENVKSVKWIADYLSQLWGNKAKWDVDEKAHAHEAQFLKLDCNKARSLLGWKPKMSIEELLSTTCSWYKAYSQHENMEKFTISQIYEYETL